MSDESETAIARRHPSQATLELTVDRRIAPPAREPEFTALAPETLICQQIVQTARTTADRG